MQSDAIALPSIGEPSIHIASRTFPPQRGVASPLPSPASSSGGISEDDSPRPPPTHLAVRPKLGSRKSSGTMIVSRDQPTTVEEGEFEEGDVRTMSPRRSSAELDKLGEDARRDFMEQAKMLQLSLQAIVDRVETVKSEHEKLEGGNKFLQSYIGELMQTSKITSSAPSKSKGRGRK